MKVTATLLSLAMAVMVADAVSIAPHSGTVIPLSFNPNHQRNFRKTMAKLAARYPQLGLHIPPEQVIVGAQDKAGTGKVPLTDVGPDSEYYGSVSVGTPAQVMRLDFDTGSADIWFPSSTCTTSGCKVHHRFNSAKSTTFKKDGRPWKIGYGDGSEASGILGSDIVNVGGIVVRQTIGLATNESAQFATSPEDGLFGLGFSTIESVAGVKTFLDNAIAAKAIALPVVSVFLPSVRKNGGQGGNYLFGGIDNTSYTGALTYVPVTKKGYWQVLIQDAAFNGKSLKQTSQGIIDTGTTLMIISNAAAAAIHKQIPGAVNSTQQGGWLVPCSLAKNTKDAVSFKMGGKSFQVPVADLAWSPISNGSKTCFSGVQGGQDGLWILGDVFIKNNYCVFSQTDSPSIGIAPLKY
ncbi:Type I transmembrane sorting receptor [Podila epicladia]|nr:Type I transmembrane sorting receptor [Podila epicladia]KAG0093029.1 Type I transmembrane sorting receptor [Podila epicladia]